MAEQQRPTLEERLAVVEDELRRAKDWRRRATRSSLLITVGLSVVLVIISQTGPGSSGATSTFRAPFTVVGSSGKPLFTIVEAQGGANAKFYNGNAVATTLFLNGGAGGADFDLLSTDHKTHIRLSGDGPQVWLYTSSTHPIASLTSQNSDPTEGTLQLYNKNGVAATLEASEQTGRLELTDEGLNVMVEAGTTVQGDGLVKVSGPTGKCNRLEPCELLGN
jgi:hypothetical protein